MTDTAKLQTTRILKPCPFCGGSDLGCSTVYLTDTWLSSVRCKGDRCAEVSGKRTRDRAEAQRTAEAKWNTRAP